MKFPQLHRSACILLATGFTFTSIFGLADAHCPANVTTLHPRIVAGAFLVIPVKINQTGPYDFVVDTGSQLNVIDPALATQLKVKAQGTVGVFASAVFSRASVAALDSLEAGPHLVSKPLFLIENLEPIQSADHKIRGIVGENFLSHFDVLIDYSRRLLCLDQAKLLQEHLRGDRIPLAASRHPDTGTTLFPRLLISVKLSDTGTRPILLQLDSGSDGPMLFAGNRELEKPILGRARLQNPGVDEARRAFALLPPQNVRIGNRVLREVHFMTPVHSDWDVPERDEDGMLPTLLFQRVFVSHADHYVIFDPR
jgi:hypothetical protein